MATASEIVVGSQVLVNSKHRAIVRYIGSTAFADGIWYGLEMEREIGKHEGTVLGVTYFAAPKKRGTFVRRENLTMYDPELEAAGKMQAVMRMSLAKKKVKQEVAWRAFNALDADDENQNLQRRQRLMNSALGQRLNRDRADVSTLERWEREASSMQVEKEYEGPHLNWPLTEEQVFGMVESFRKGHRLHYKYAFQLACAYKRYVNDLPTLVEAVIPEGTRLTVCGDTHGQLQDLLAIFTVNGVPSPTNRYLMNGDFVDRGDYSCEILFTLMGYALLYPGEQAKSSCGAGARLNGAACMLNRGNHESSNQNITGGFMMEVLDKYSFCLNTGAGDNDSAAEVGLRMYDAFQAAFDCMPLATLLASPSKRVFVVHGGLMARSGVTLAHIAAIKRKREIPYGLPGFEDKLFEDLMWSDPRPAYATTPSDRGAGVFFGPDITERFCTANGINLVIRSHECMPEGYSFHHDNQLITVFSASRYCGRGTNRGAYVVFESDMTYSVPQYAATLLASTAPAKKVPGSLQAALTAASEHGIELCFPVVRARLGEAPGAPSPPGTEANAADAAAASNPAGHVQGSELHAAQETAIRGMLMERIVLHKPDLYFYWSTQERAKDSSKCDGRITKLQWAEGMRTVLNLELPWLTLAGALVEFEPDGRVNYGRFLDRYRIAMRESDAAWMEGIVEKACQKLFEACQTLEAAFTHLDTDKSGVIEFEELERGLSKLNIGLSRQQTYELMASMDTDRDGRIQFAEFANRFKLVFARLQDESAARGGRAAKTADTWILQALQRIGNALFGGPGGYINAPAVFSGIDTDGDGLLSPEEFTAAIAALDLGLNREACMKIVEFTDANRSGAINYLEFMQAFKIADMADNPVASYAPVYPPAEATEAPASPAGGAAAAPEASSPNRRSLTLGSPVKMLSSQASSASLLAAAAAKSGNETPRTWQRGVIEQIVACLFEYRLELTSAFRMFDLNGDGVISREEFRQGLQALTSLNGSPITDMQADEMLKVLDANGDGNINYDEFCSAFRLVDAKAA